MNKNNMSKEEVNLELVYRVAYGPKRGAEMAKEERMNKNNQVKCRHATTLTGQCIKCGRYPYDLHSTDAIIALTDEGVPMEYALEILNLRAHAERLAEALKGYLAFRGSSQYAKATAALAAWDGAQK